MHAETIHGTCHFFFLIFVAFSAQTVDLLFIDFKVKGFVATNTITTQRKSIQVENTLLHELSSWILSH